MKELLFNAKIKQKFYAVTYGSETLNNEKILYCKTVTMILIRRQSFSNLTITFERKVY